MVKKQESEQELIAKFSMFEQQIRLLQEQLRAIEQRVLELSDLESGLDELIGKTGSEIFAPIGNGIYAKAELKSEDLLINIGERNLVKKSIPETKKILKEQIIKLGEMKKELNGDLDKINEEITKTFIEHQNKN